MNASMGERLTLRYKQHDGFPSICFGDTQCFVQRVRRVEN